VERSNLLILSGLVVGVEFLLLLVLDIGLHVGDEVVDIPVLNLILRHLHGVLDHLVDELHAFLLSGVGLHGVLELLDVDLVLGVAHDLGHAVHDVGHLVHGLHGLQSTYQI